MQKKFFFEEVIKKSWWLFFFIFICLFLYGHFAKKGEAELKKQKIRVSALENRVNEASFKRDDLILQLNSQSDPDWVEMVLMKQLGVVPEGYIKVHFKKE